MMAAAAAAMKASYVPVNVLRRYGSSWWHTVPAGSPDAILGITEAYNKDPNPRKINLGAGAYRNDAGKPYVLDVVRKAEEYIKAMDKEYAPISGLASFTELSAELALGKDNKIQSDNRIATIQTISGTGALRLGGAFLKSFSPSPDSSIYFPSPTWGNHHAIFKAAGLSTYSYRYYDPRTHGLDLAGMLEDISAAPERSTILLHACAHNPTGVDPSNEQWQRIEEVVRERNHLVLFDMAYQGFASGDFSRDAYALRLFACERDHNVILSQSFAKNMGLYGERTGALSIICSNAQEKNNVMSQLKILVRAMYSNPPIHGARIAGAVMADPELNSLWKEEVRQMADRIILMRSMLSTKLATLGSTLDWSHITNQIGMFCYTGLLPNQVDRLASEFSVYLTRDGRISIASISSSNVDYLAESIHAVTK